MTSNGVRANFFVKEPGGIVRRTVGTHDTVVEQARQELRRRCLLPSQQTKPGFFVKGSAGELKPETIEVTPATSGKEICALAAPIFHELLSDQGSLDGVSLRAGLERFGIAVSEDDATYLMSLLSADHDVVDVVVFAEFVFERDLAAESLSHPKNSGGESNSRPRAPKQPGKSLRKKGAQLTGLQMASRTAAELDRARAAKRRQKHESAAVQRVREELRKRLKEPVKSKININLALEGTRESKHAAGYFVKTEAGLEERTIEDEDIRRASDIFTELDTDGSGALDADEMITGLGRFGIALSTDELELLMAAFDGSAEVNFQAFTRFLLDPESSDDEGSDGDDDAGDGGSGGSGAEGGGRGTSLGAAESRGRPATALARQSLKAPTSGPHAPTARSSVSVSASAPASARPPHASAGVGLLEGWTSRSRQRPSAGGARTAQAMASQPSSPRGPGRADGGGGRAPLAADGRAAGGAHGRVRAPRSSHPSSPRSFRPSTQKPPPRLGRAGSAPVARPRASAEDPAGLGALEAMATAFAGGGTQPRGSPVSPASSASPTSPAFPASPAGSWAAPRARVVSDADIASWQASAARLVEAGEWKGESVLAGLRRIRNHTHDQPSEAEASR